MNRAIYPGIPHKEFSESSMWVMFVIGWSGSLYLMTFALWLLFSVAQIVPNYLPSVKLLSISLIYLFASYLFTLVFIASISLLKVTYALAKGLWSHIISPNVLSAPDNTQIDSLLELVFDIEDISSEIESYKKGSIDAAMIWSCLSFSISFLANIIGTYVVISEIDVLKIAQKNVPVQFTIDWLSNLGLPGFLFSVILETEFVSQYPKIFFLLLVIPGILSMPMLLNILHILERFHYKVFTNHANMIRIINDERQEILIPVLFVIMYTVIHITAVYFRPW